MHIADFSVGMLGANGVVAAGMPIAVGAAHSVRIRGRPGDRRLLLRRRRDQPRPVRSKALNWAQVFLLPVLFVCEDNRWSATTPTRALTAGEGAAARARVVRRSGADGRRQRRRGRRRRGRGAGRRDPRAARVRGCCTRSPTASKATSRSTPRPTAIRRSSRRALADDPLPRARARLQALGVGAARLDALEAAARSEIAAAVAAAAIAPAPGVAAAYGEIQDCGAGRWRS